MIPDSSNRYIFLINKQLSSQMNNNLENEIQIVNIKHPKNSKYLKYT